MIDLPGSPHIDNETLESYAMKKLPETEAAPVEEHLLICHGCQVRLARIDSFLANLHSALGPPQ